MVDDARCGIADRGYRTEKFRADILAGLSYFLFLNSFFLALFSPSAATLPPAEARVMKMA